MMKKISVIIPCYNASKFIDRCIESLVHQTIGIENLELIFVNDASTDDTLTHLIHYENLYPESILVINLDVNRKQGGARNIGLEYASADYIGFVDADDWIELSMYEKLYQKAIEYDCDMVSCLFKRDFDKIPLSMGRSDKTDTFCNIKDVTTRKKFMITDYGTGGVCTKLYQKELLSKANISFPEQTAYEDNYWCVLFKFYFKKVYILQEYLYHYYVNENSTTLCHNSPHHFQRLSIELLKIEELKNRDLFKIYKEEIELLFLKLYYSISLNIFFTRYDIIPVDIFPEMKETVLKLFPNYQENKYLNEYTSGLEKILLKTLTMNLNKNEWLYLANHYKQYLND